MNADVYRWMLSGCEKKTMVEQKVTYTLEINGKFIIIENVPARVPSEPKKPGFLRLLWAVTKYNAKKTGFWPPVRQFY